MSYDAYELQVFLNQFRIRFKEKTAEWKIGVRNSDFPIKQQNITHLDILKFNSTFQKNETFRSFKKFQYFVHCPCIFCFNRRIANNSVQIKFFFDIDTNQGLQVLLESELVNHREQRLRSLTNQNLGTFFRPP